MNPLAESQGMIDMLVSEHRHNHHTGCPLLCCAQAPPTWPVQEVCDATEALSLTLRVQGYTGGATRNSRSQVMVCRAAHVWQPAQVGGLRSSHDNCRGLYDACSSVYQETSCGEVEETVEHGPSDTQLQGHQWLLLNATRQPLLLPGPCQTH